MNMPATLSAAPSKSENGTVAPSGRVVPATVLTSGATALRRLRAATPPHVLWYGLDPQMKTVRQQIDGMRRRWPSFDAAEVGSDRAVWFGALAGIELQYRIMIQFGFPDPTGLEETLWRLFPVVRVLTPALCPNWDPRDEAPLPHVYFQEPDITLSPLCLFDPHERQWSHDDLIADKRQSLGRRIGSLATRDGSPPVVGPAAVAMPTRPPREETQ